MARKSKPFPTPRRPSRVSQIPAAAGGRWASGRRIAISAFLIFHIVAIACWCVPITTPFTALGKELVRPYFLWSGLFQSWDMFSPSPKTVNSYVEAIVLYKDGNTRNWPFPRMEQLSLSGRYVKERYRKFEESLQDDRNSPLWPDAARWIARLNNTRPVPIKMVLLVRYWSDIVPPTDGASPSAPWDSHVFYGYTVKPGDLN